MMMPGYRGNYMRNTKTKAIIWTFYGTINHWNMKKGSEKSNENC